MKTKPRMTVAFVAEQLAGAYPDCYAEFSDFMRKKRMIGLVNHAMTRGDLQWIVHRGQRRITPEQLAAWLAQAEPTFERIAGQSRDVLARPERSRPIEERYPLRTESGEGRRKRRSRPAGSDMGQNLGEIDD